MNVKHKKITLYVSIGTILALIAIFIPFPQGASLKAIVSASQQYQLISNGSGTYTTIHKDLWKNQDLEVAHFVPDRGGLVAYKVNTALPEGAVTAGDTLGWLYSSSLLERVASLEGNISTLRASLDFERSGNKATEIEAARLRLNYAETRLEEQRKILDRSKSLLDGKIIPQQEYDLEVRRERLDAIRVAIAEADLGSALSGAQTRKLDIFRSQIADEEKKLALAREVLSQMTFVSPLSGKVFFPLSEDTLITIEDVETLVVTLPIRGSSHNRVDWSSPVTLTTQNFELVVTPDQMQVERRILRAGVEQLLLVRLQVDNRDDILVPGQMLEVAVKFTSKSVFQMLKELM